jgi:hypothetical protein
VLWLREEFQKNLALKFTHDAIQTSLAASRLTNFYRSSC